jgi:hypothetical protein
LYSSIFWTVYTRPILLNFWIPFKVQIWNNCLTFEARIHILIFSWIKMFTFSIWYVVFLI